jgi:hypothetical protein
MWRNFFKPEHINWRRAYCLICGVYIHFFVIFFEPYKGDKITYIWASTYDYICHHIYNFVNVVFFCALVTLILPKRFPSYFLPEKLSFRRFFMLVALAPTGMGVFYFIGNYYYFHYEITLSWFLIYMFKVMVTNAFFAGVPFIIVYLSIFDYFTNTKNNPLNETSDGMFYAAEPTLAAQNPIVEAPPQYPHEISTQRPIMLSFTDSTNKKSLDVALNHLYYITSAQNYIEIFHGNKNAIKSTVLRQSLKTIEEDMIVSSDSPLIRCHKAFIVNREKVIELRGTAKTAHFILEDVDVTIPVSRQKYPEVEAKFLN